MNKLREIYCYSNNLTSSALDSIYCALPEYSDIGNDYGEIVVYADDLHASSVYPIVMASNSQNAISKGWHVVDRAFQDMPPTNGTFDCSNIGIEDIELSKIEAKVYPNPAINNLSVEAKENIQMLEVFDALGRMVISTNPKQKSITLDVSNLDKGIYILKLQTKKGIGSYKVIKN